MDRLIPASAHGHKGMQQEEQKLWKVGTYSMGLTLIGIGLAFAASLWQATSAYQMLLWLAPIVFIILGIELIVVHSSKFQYKYKLQYNWVAVWFVGVIGVGALMLAAFLSSGLLEEVNQAFHVQERNIYVEEKAELPQQSIDKIIIHSSLNYKLEQQKSIEEITLLGTVQYEAHQALQHTKQELLRTSQVGNILYVFIQDIEYDSNFFANSYTKSQLVLNVPEHIIVEEG